MQGSVRVIFQGASGSHGLINLYWRGPMGGFWSKLLLKAGSAYEIKLGCSRFCLGGSCKPSRTETAQCPWPTSVLCGPCGDP